MDVGSVGARENLNQMVHLQDTQRSWTENSRTLRYFDIQLANSTLTTKKKELTCAMYGPVKARCNMKRNCNESILTIGTSWSVRTAAALTRDSSSFLKKYLRNTIRKHWRLKSVLLRWSRRCLSHPFLQQLAGGSSLPTRIIEER